MKPLTNENMQTIKHNDDLYRTANKTLAIIQFLASNKKITKRTHYRLTASEIDHVRDRPCCDVRKCRLKHFNSTTFQIDHVFN